MGEVPPHIWGQIAFGQGMGFPFLPTVSGVVKMKNRRKKARVRATIRRAICVRLPVMPRQNVSRLI